MADRNLSNSSIPKNAMNSFIRSCKNEALPGALETCQRLKKVLPGNLSYHSMHSAGLEYTNDGDIARCRTCGLEVSDLTSDIKPFAIHKQRSPSCLFVLSISPTPTNITPTTNNPPSIFSALVNEEQPLKRLKTDTPVTNSLSNILVEVNTLKRVRKRTFSHWPHRSSPSVSQMIEAGFFNCNVGDRVICIYCNLICEQWTPNSDDPCEVHKTLSPKCPYVIGILTAPQTTSTLHVQKNSSNSDSQQIIANLNKTAINKKYIEAKKRLASFATWLDGNLPSIDDLVRAGFFYTGTKSKVTCFYCNGSLQNWGTNDNPMVEHARWFPHCAYAKQLCGVELRRTIQESKRAQQGLFLFDRDKLCDAFIFDLEKVNTHHSNNALETGHGSSISERLSIPDEDTLSEMVVARLDLPISKCMINRNFKQSIIKKCWEDQLRLKGMMQVILIFLIK